MFGFLRDFSAASPFTNERHATFFKLGFTQGGLEEFLEKLADTLRQREWEKKATKPEPKRRMGILGIERDIRDEARRTDQQINEAFHDLKSLVEMAKPMVQLAKRISDKAAVSLLQFFLFCGTLFKFFMHCFNF